MTDFTINHSIARTIGMVTLLALIVAPNAGSADESKTNPPAGIDNAKVSPIAVHRDPFWPVGYTPKWVTDQAQGTNEKVVEKEGTDWNRAMKQVSIQGVSSRAGNEFFAIINGEVKSTGETVSVKIGAVNYTWMIDGISPPSSVKLRRVSAQ